MDIYLLRHGETDWNRQGLLQGHTDIPLNENGRRQVYETAQKLADLNVKMDLILSSPLKRAYESAEIAAGRLEYPLSDIVVEPGLIERGFGEGEGMALAERIRQFPDNNYPGMEPQADLIRRAGLVFEKIVNTYQDAERILLTAHGAVLFAVLEAVSGEGIIEAGRAAALAQGSIYRIRHTDSGNVFSKYDVEKNVFLTVDREGIARSVKIYMQ